MAALTLIVAAPALAAPSVHGATEAVTRVVNRYAREEGGTVYYYGTPQVTCHRASQVKFTCRFNILKHESEGWRRTSGGHVSVTYSHGRYHVGELHYE